MRTDEQKRPYHNQNSHLGEPNNSNHCNEINDKKSDLMTIRCATAAVAKIVRFERGTKIVV